MAVFGSNKCPFGRLWFGGKRLTGPSLAAWRAGMTLPPKQLLQNTSPLRSAFRLQLLISVPPRPVQPRTSCDCLDRFGLQPFVFLSFHLPCPFLFPTKLYFGELRGLFPRGALPRRLCAQSFAHPRNISCLPPCSAHHTHSRRRCTTPCRSTSRLFRSYDHPRLPPAPRSHNSKALRVLLRPTPISSKGGPAGMSLGRTGSL